MVVEKEPVPLPVTSQVSDIVWSHVFVPDRFVAEIAPVNIAPESNARSSIWS